MSNELSRLRNDLAIKNAQLEAHKQRSGSYGLGWTMCIGHSTMRPLIEECRRLEKRICELELLEAAEMCT